MIEVRKNSEGRLAIFRNGEEYNTDTKILLSAGTLVHTSRGNGVLMEYGELIFLMCDDGARVQL